MTQLDRLSVTTLGTWAVSRTGSSTTILGWAYASESNENKVNGIVVRHLPYVPRERA